MAMPDGSGASSSSMAPAQAQHDDFGVTDDLDSGVAGALDLAVATAAAAAGASSTPPRAGGDDDANSDDVAKAYLKLENEVYSTQLRPFDAYKDLPIDEILKVGDTFKYRRQAQVAMFEAAARYGVTLKCKKMSSTRMTMCSAKDGEEFVLAACFARRRLGMKKKSRGGHVVANGNPWKVTKVRMSGACMRAFVFVTLFSYDNGYSCWLLTLVEISGMLFTLE
jgi:hypothetical protein